MLGYILSPDFRTDWVGADVVRAAVVPVRVPWLDDVTFKVGRPAMSATIWVAGWAIGLSKDKYRVAGLSELLDYSGYER